MTPSIPDAFWSWECETKLKHVVNKGLPSVLHLLLPKSIRSMMPIRGTSMSSKTAWQNICMRNASPSNRPLWTDANSHRVGSIAEKHPIEWNSFKPLKFRRSTELPKVKLSTKLLLQSYPLCLRTTSDQLDARVAKTLRSRMFEHFLSAIANSVEIFNLMLQHGLFRWGIVPQPFAIPVERQM